MSLNRLIPFLATVALLFGCVKEMDNEVHTYDCFYATVEGDGGDDATKAYFAKSSATSGNHAVKWNDNDKIGIISDEQKSPLEFNGNSSGVFTRDGGINGSNLIAFYPYPTNYYSNTKVVKFGSIAPAFDEKSISMPMVATRNGNTLNFKQTCGVLHFFIKGTGSYSKISLKSNNKTAIYGPGEVDVSSNANLDKPVFNLSSSSSSSDEIVANVPKEGLDWNKGVDVYFVLPPIPLNNGFTLTVTTTDNKPLTKSKTGSVSIARGKMTRYELTLDDIENSTEHEYVDLGLGVCWATMNVGAKKPEEYGDYFAWGETDSKSNYNWAKYKFEQGTDYSGPFSKYVSSSSYGSVDNKTTLDLSDDAARAKWGGTWRMPTDAEWTELRNTSNCSWQWTDNYSGIGVKGYIVTSRKAGYTDKFIFLPAAGHRYDTNISGVGSKGYYWSSSLQTAFSSRAWSVTFDKSDVLSDDNYRFNGYSVRPVFEQSIPVTGVTVDPNELTLQVGENATLTATVIPDNASDKSVTWSSSDSKIVSVINKESGEIKALSIGTAIITVKTNDGGKTSDCTVTVKMAVPDMVDLGLSVKWGSFNVGATKPGEVGSYFSWGELTPKSNYDWSSYSLCNGTQASINKYTKTDGYTVLDASDDAAAYNLEGSWRMPTEAEMEALINNCTWKWEIRNGTGGYLVTSDLANYTGRSIFLPVTGRYSGISKWGSSSDGKYWSSSLHPDWQESAYTIDFDDKNNHSISYSDRFQGLAIRPVSPFNWHYLGKGTLTDGLLLPLFDMQDATVSCDVYQEDDLPGVYAILGFQLELASVFYGVNPSDLEPYEGKDKIWYNAPVFIDATNPNAVSIDPGPYGIYVNEQYGYVYIKSDAAGTLKNGVITFPADNVYAGLDNVNKWYYGYNKGTFKITLPGAASAPALSSRTSGKGNKQDFSLSERVVLKKKAKVNDAHSARTDVFFVNEKDRKKISK